MHNKTTNDIARVSNYLFLTDHNANSYTTMDRYQAQNRKGDDWTCSSLRTHSNAQHLTMTWLRLEGGGWRTTSITTLSKRGAHYQNSSWFR